MSLRRSSRWRTFSRHNHNEARKIPPPKFCLRGLMARGFCRFRRRFPASKRRWKRPPLFPGTTRPLLPGAPFPHLLICLSLARLSKTCPGDRYCSPENRTIRRSSPTAARSNRTLAASLFDVNDRSNISATIAGMSSPNWKRNMGQRNHAKEKISLDGLPKETIAAVIIAQMYQVQAIADEHRDAGAREMLYMASNLVLDLLNGYTTPAVVAAIPQIQAIIAGQGE